MEAGRSFKDYRVCPKTGKVYKARRHFSWYRLFFPLTGLLATIWFLIRVIPKPSRATYPCQRMAFPIASSFVTYLIGIFTTAAIMKRATAHIRRAKYIIAAVCLLAAITTAWFTIGIDAFRAQGYVFEPNDGSNNPMGIARGIYPGRVVWVHDPNSTDWSPSLNSSTTEYWWDDNHTNQAVVDQMYSKGLRWLTNSTTDANAWDKLFRYFNQHHGKGDVGYTSGEKIAIKPNHVQQRSLTYADTSQAADLCPQTVVSLLKQLVWEAGVPQDCITICDSSRYISNKIFNRCYALFPNVHYLSTNFYTAYGDDRYADPCRPPVAPSTTAFTYYSGKTETGKSIARTPQPVPFDEADYVINLAIMKGHSRAGVTLCGKNWYGNFCAAPGGTEDIAHTLLPETVRTMGHYRLMVDLMGNKNFGEKTFLFILDGLWGFQHHGSKSRPIAFNYPPFNDDYPSSLFMSQDMVAIDSVGTDFLTAQFADNMGGTYNHLTTGIDDYLHEAALADNPPSGTIYGYDTNGNPARFTSLGVHEHWNNPIDKQYTRNLGTGSGIELVSNDPLLCSSTGRSVADITRDCSVDAFDYAKMTDQWLADPEIITNGDFTSDLTGWILVHPAGSTGTMTAVWDGTAGSPAGSVKIAKSAGAVSGHKFYQVIPVTNGSHYRVTAQWKGSLSGGTNSANVYVSFVSSPPPTSWGSAMYTKSSGTWDWENITIALITLLASPDVGLADGVFKATDDYMVVAFDIGGSIGSSAVYYWLDNVSVHETGSDPDGDVSGDWFIDWGDISDLADDWLLSGVTP